MHDTVRLWQQYLFPFGVSTLNPLHGHALIVCVQGCDHSLVDPSYRKKDCKVMLGLCAAYDCRKSRFTLSHDIKLSHKPKDKQRQI